MALERNFVVELFWRWHPRLYRWSGGRIGGELAGLPVLLLETQGRRSGERRETALTFLPYVVPDDPPPAVPDGPPREVPDGPPREVSDGRPSAGPADRGRFPGRASEGDAFVVIASVLGEPWHPAWYLNLVADPNVAVTVGARRIAVRARDAEGEERERLWDEIIARSPDYAQYRERTDRRIPVVVLERRTRAKA